MSEENLISVNLKKRKLPLKYVLFVLLGIVVAFFVGYLVYVGFNFKK